MMANSRMLKVWTLPPPHELRIERQGREAALLGDVRDRGIGEGTRHEQCPDRQEHDRVVAVVDEALAEEVEAGVVESGDRVEHAPPECPAGVHLAEEAHGQHDRPEGLGNEGEDDHVAGQRDDRAEVTAT